MFKLLTILALLIDILLIITFAGIMKKRMNSHVPDGGLLGELVLMVTFILNMLAIIGGLYVI